MFRLAKSDHRYFPLFTNHQSRFTNHVPAGSGDCFKYAATPMMADISALTPAMARVECRPACRLKCSGSMPTAAKPVMTPLAPPAIAAATSPRHHTRKFVQAVMWSQGGLSGACFSLWILIAHAGLRVQGQKKNRKLKHTPLKYKFVQ